MTEVKRERPGLEAISLPGNMPGEGETPADALVRDVEQGVAEHRYLRGMPFPEAGEVQRLYALSAPEVESVIRRLRAERLLQRHDEYRDTYFIDVGRADRRLRPGPGASAEQTDQVARLTERRANAVIIGSTAAVIAAIVTTGIVVVGATTGSTPNDDKPSTTAAPSSAGEDLAAPFAEPDPEPDPEPTYAQVDADSFSIDLRTTERQCFGSAGCNVTVEPELTYLGSSGDLDPDAVYEITYEIHGDESGPVIQTAELTNQTSLSYRPSLISTASASTELSVEITDITSA